MRASEEHAGLYIAVGQPEAWGAALFAKFIIPSSTIPGILGLPCQSAPGLREVLEHGDPFVMCGALRKKCGWPLNYVCPDDYTPGSPEGGNFGEPRNTCIHFTTKTTAFQLVSVGFPYWQATGVDAWWRDNILSDNVLELVFQTKTRLAWPCERNLCLGLWALNERGYTQWEAPMISLSDTPPRPARSIPEAARVRDGVLQGRFRPLPYSLGSVETPFRVRGASGQNLIFVHPDSKTIRFVLLPSNLGTSFGEMWREIGKRIYSFLEARNNVARSDA